MSLKDDMLKHRIFLQRLQHSQYNVIDSHLKKLENAAKIEAVSGTQGTTLINSLRSIMEPMSNLAIDSLTDIGEYEASFAAKVYSKYFNTNIQPVDASAIRKSLITDNMPLNAVKRSGTKYVTDLLAPKKSLSVAYSQYGRRKADELVQVIRDSQAQGLGMTDTIKAISEKVAGLQRTQAMTLAQTSVNYTANTAKSQVMDNTNVIQYVQWDADAELNHCDYCEEQDGQVWPINEAPDTQVHWGCNCELVPVENG